jgi:hypothetical protein
MAYILISGMSRAYIIISGMSRDFAWVMFFRVNQPISGCWIMVMVGHIMCAGHVR